VKPTNASKGAARIDGQSLSDFAADLQSNLHTLLLNRKVKRIKRDLFGG
jgi:RNA-directed DNA polymerase